MYIQFQNVNLNLMYIPKAKQVSIKATTRNEPHNRAHLLFYRIRMEAAQFGASLRRHYTTTTRHATHAFNIITTNSPTLAHCVLKTNTLGGWYIKTWSQTIRVAREMQSLRTKPFAVFSGRAARSRQSIFSSMEYLHDARKWRGEHVRWALIWTTLSLGDVRRQID